MGGVDGSAQVLLLLVALDQHICGKVQIHPALLRLAGAFCRAFPVLAVATRQPPHTNFDSLLNSLANRRRHPILQSVMTITIGSSS